MTNSPLFPSAAKAHKRPEKIDPFLVIPESLRDSFRDFAREVWAYSERNKNENHPERYVAAIDLLASFSIDLHKSRDSPLDWEDRHLFYESNMYKLWGRE